MTANTGSTIYINYADTINDGKARALMALCSQLVTNEKPDTLYFLFSSQGGGVNAGITLHNFLKALPCKIVMHNTGNIDSIATVIFLAGDERYSAQGTSFLFHGIGMDVKNHRFNVTNLVELLSSLKQDEHKIAHIVARNCDLTSAEMESLFRQGEAKDLDFALSKGIIHEIRDAAIPANAKLFSCNFN